MIKIYFNNIKCFCLRKKISALFHDAVSLKFTENDIQNKFFEIDLKFISGKEIRKLNKQFRDVDRETDVLSFPMIEFGNSPNEIDFENDIMLGDIVICKKVAKRQAKEYGHSYIREVCFLTLHGCLHLLGYDHINPEDEKIMMEEATKILEKNKIIR